MKRVRKQLDIDSVSVPFNTKLKYGDICDIFGLEKKGGSYITNQISELRKNYNIIKDGRDYLITHRYTPEEILRLQYYNNLKQHVEVLLCTLFTLPKLEPIKTFYMKDLLEILSLVNPDYYKTKFEENLQIAMDLLEVKDDSLEFFMNETQPMLRRLVNDALDDLEDKKLITIYRIPVLAKTTIDDYGNKITKTHELSLDNKDIVSQDELDSLLHCFLIAQYDTMHELGFEKESELVKKGLPTINKYRGLTAKKLKHDYYYYKYRLTLNTAYIQNYAIQDIKERNKINKACNNLVKTKILNSNQGKLKQVSCDDRVKYIDAFIDIDNDYGFRTEYDKIKRQKGDQLNVQ